MNTAIAFENIRKSLKFYFHSEINTLITLSCILKFYYFIFTRDYKI